MNKKIPALVNSFCVLMLFSMPGYALPPLSASDVFQLSYASSPVVDVRGERVIYLRHSMDIMKDRAEQPLDCRYRWQ